MTRTRSIILRLNKKPGRFSWKADKIVGGKPVTIGTVECSYDAENHVIEGLFPGGIWEFEGRGSILQGTMKLPDGTLWRKLSRKKVP